MGWRIIKQPNGLFARFSEIVDDFTDFDMSKEDVVELCKTEYDLGSEASQRKIQSAIDNPQRWNEAFETIRAVHGDNTLSERMQQMGNGNNEVKCEQCDCNLNAAWHDSVHEMWEVSQQNAWEYEREQRKRVLSPNNSKDDRIQYILKLCLESDDIRHKQWGLWKIGEILDIDISDVDADSGREP